jgi:hypothetical protein
MPPAAPGPPSPGPGGAAAAAAGWRAGDAGSGSPRSSMPAHAETTAAQETIRVTRRKTNRRHMTGDHHGQTPRIQPCRSQSRMRFSARTRWGPEPGSLEQAGEQLFPAGAAIGVIQAHEGRGQPEPFVFLHLPGPAASAPASACPRRESARHISPPLQRWPGSTAGAGPSHQGQGRARSVLATDQP